MITSQCGTIFTRSGMPEEASESELVSDLSESELTCTGTVSKSIFKVRGVRYCYNKWY